MNKENIKKGLVGMIGGAMIAAYTVLPVKDVNAAIATQYEVNPETGTIPELGGIDFKDVIRSDNAGMFYVAKTSEKEADFSYKQLDGDIGTSIKTNLEGYFGEGASVSVNEPSKVYELPDDEYMFNNPELNCINNLTGKVTLGSGYSFTDGFVIDPEGLFVNTQPCSAGINIGLYDPKSAVAWLPGVKETSAVPIPRTVGLLGVGLAALAYARRKEDEIPSIGSGSMRAIVDSNNQYNI